MSNIDEVIADAIAEETTKPKKETEIKVTVNLSEYVALKKKETDLDRILTALFTDAELNYSKDGLRLNAERAGEAISVLYPEAYYGLVKDLKGGE